MAKDREEREENVALVNRVVDDDTLIETLNRFRAYVIEGKPYRCNDEDKDYVVELSKEASVVVTVKGQPHTINLPGKTPLDCDHVILRELVLKAIQEGPVGMKQRFEDRSGDARALKPLQLTLISASERKGSRFNYLKGKVPELVS